MGLATRNGFLAAQYIATAIAAVGLLLWMDSRLFDFAGYTADPLTKLAVCWLAATAAFLARQMIVKPNELAWGLLVSAGAMTFVLSANANFDYPSCPNYTILSYLSPLSQCYEQSAVASAILWTITAGSLLIALLALCLPIVELWDRQRLEY